MKLEPKVGDALTVVQGKHEFAATVIAVKDDGAIVCKVQKVWPGEMTFGADGRGHHGARLQLAKLARGVRVKGAVSKLTHG